MTEWNPMEVIRKPMMGLHFVEFHLSHHFLTFAIRASRIDLLEMPNPVGVFPKVESAPELEKYCCAENGIVIKVNAKANDKKECVGLYNPLGFDISRPFDYLQIEDLFDIRLIYDRTYELAGTSAYPENFIEVRFPHVYRYIDGFGDPRGNWLNKSWIDNGGNLNIKILPDED